MGGIIKKGMLQPVSMDQALVFLIVSLVTAFEETTKFRKHFKCI